MNAKQRKAAEKAARKSGGVRARRRCKTRLTRLEASAVGRGEAAAADAELDDEGDADGTDVDDEEGEVTEGKSGKKKSKKGGKGKGKKGTAVAFTDAKKRRLVVSRKENATGGWALKVVVTGAEKKDAESGKMKAGKSETGMVRDVATEGEAVALFAEWVEMAKTNKWVPTAGKGKNVTSAFEAMPMAEVDDEELVDETSTSRSREWQLGRAEWPAPRPQRAATQVSGGRWGGGFSKEATCECSLSARRQTPSGNWWRRCSSSASGCTRRSPWNAGQRSCQRRRRASGWKSVMPGRRTA